MRPTALGALATAAAAAATLLVPAPLAAARPATPQHVGIVVRFAGGAVSTACTNAGGNGYAILQRAGYDLYVGTSGPYAGFLLQINSQPAHPRPDNTHYWSYWHSSGNGSWRYSGSGAGSSTPAAGTVEGWSYVDGSSTAPPPPPRSYSALCAASDPRPAPRPAPKPAPTHRLRPTHTATHAATHTATAAAPSPSDPAPPAARTAPRQRRSAHPTHRPASSAHDVAAARTSAADTSSTLTQSSSAPAPRTVGASPAAHDSGSGVPAWATLLALAVVVALGGAAWLRLRRRPE
jgi:hypothetical protein